MSLLDAFLFEPYRDPLEIWIAVRVDGQLGTGTLADPYDGSRRRAKVINVNSLTNAGDVATATTASAHFYIEGDVVTVDGVTGASEALWNGSFVVQVPSGTTFTYRMTGVPSAAAGGSITAARNVFRFDEVMRPLLPNAVVWLGPGVFETRGFDPSLNVALRWSVRPGQRIRGSGMGATILKVVHGRPFGVVRLQMAINSSRFVAPADPNVDHVEVSDLTIDCDMRSQLKQIVAKAGVGLAGRHTRIRRVRVIDYGTHDFEVECFPLTVAQGDPRFPESVDARIEDCVAEHPSLHSRYNNSCMVTSSGEDDWNRMGYHRACAIRNNYINNEYVDRPVSIENLKFQGGAWIVTTRGPHGRSPGEWVVISGVLDSSGVTDRYGFSTYFNGSFQITIPGGAPDTQFQISPAGSPSTGLVGSGPMWVGVYPSRRISIHELVRASAPLSETTAILKAYGPHYRRPGQWIEVLGSAIRSSNEEPYYGRLEVLSVGNPLTGLPDPSMLTYRMPSRPGTPGVSDATPPPSGYFADGVFVGNTAVGFTTDGGSEAVAEGNRVFSTFVGGSYHDTWRTKDQTDRNNYASDVQTGPNQHMLTDSGPLIQVQTISVVGTTATVTTVDLHDLVPGNGVRISEKPVNPVVNKFYRVATIGTKLFTFDTVGDPPPVSPLPYFAPMWQVLQTVRENNVIEFSDASHEVKETEAIGGMPFSARSHSVKFFQMTIVRNNVLSVISSTFDNRKPAAQFSDTERALMNGNLIDLTAPSQISVTTSSALLIDDNRTSTGLAIRPTVTQPNAALPDSLATRIADALILSL